MSMKSINGGHFTDMIINIGFILDWDKNTITVIPHTILDPECVGHTNLNWLPINFGRWVQVLDLTSTLI